jgi:hypothetical protein
VRRAQRATHHEEARQLPVEQLEPVHLRIPGRPPCGARSSRVALVQPRVVGRAASARHLVVGLEPRGATVRAERRPAPYLRPDRRPALKPLVPNSYSIGKSYT